jgi:hypothetical protein
MEANSRNVLIVFHAESADMEGVVLACALGAVQAGALIRLRRLASNGAPALQHEGYVAPGEKDLEWADVVIVALEPSARVEDIDPFLQLLKHRNQAPLKRLKGWCFSQIGEETPSIVEILSLLQDAMQSTNIDLWQKGNAHAIRIWTADEILLVGKNLASEENAIS